MNYLITLKKAVLGFLTGLAAVIVLAIIQAVTSYHPVACADGVTENCMPQYLIAAYNLIIPSVCAFLVGIANWLKNRAK